MGRSGNYPQISGYQSEGRLLNTAVDDSSDGNGHSRPNAIRGSSLVSCPMPVALPNHLSYFTRDQLRLGLRSGHTDAERSPNLIIKVNREALS